MSCGLAWMRTRIAVALVVMLASVAARAAELVSRFGTVTALKADASDTSLTIAIDHRPLATVEADDISLYRVTARKDAFEYLIVEKWLPGLHCHRQYMLLEILPDKATALSPAFGNCMELEGATLARGGVEIALRSPFIEGVKPHTEMYFWKNGKLQKR